MENIPLRPAWVEIKLTAIENNARRLKQIIGDDSELMAMVKANAYGHGAVESAKAALRGGATWLGVYTAGEGIELRENGITAPILVLGPTLPQWMQPALASDLILTLPSKDYFQPLLDAAHALHKKTRVHIKIDTGMTRLGLDADSAAQDILRLTQNDNLEIEGILTHFAVADDPDARGIPHWGKEFTRKQMETLLRVADELAARGIVPKYLHAANSPGAVHYKHPRLNLVRTGILLYGLHPSPETPRPADFIPALTFKTRLALVREVPAGRFVSYGATFETARPSRIGVLMVGYADGFRRAPNNYGTVLVRGARAPIVGRVCMDQTMIDVTDIPDAQMGDEVVLIGRQANEEISAEEAAAQLGTNNYETVTTIAARVPRIYLNKKSSEFLTL
ncbi:MAG TPA: alanine racemase [Anaerolineae bacterium]|nr:alanine racemase [Anaerolineae bacterium]